MRCLLCSWGLQISQARLGFLTSGTTYAPPPPTTTTYTTRRTLVPRLLLHDQLTNLRELWALLLQDGKAIVPPLELPNNISGIHDWKERGLPAQPPYMSNLMGLGLTEMKIAGVPDLFGNFSALKSISLTNNDLVEYPRALEKMTGLLSVYLSNNKIQEIPPWVGQANQRMKHWSFRGNRVTRVPPEIGRLTNLRTIVASQNRILSEGLPKELAEIKRMNALDLGGNALTAVPLWMVVPSGTETAGAAGATAAATATTAAATAAATSTTGTTSGLSSHLLSILPQMRYLNLDGNRVETLPSAWAGAFKAERPGRAAQQEIDATVRAGKVDALLVRVGGNPATAGEAVDTVLAARGDDGPGLAGAAAAAVASHVDVYFSMSPSCTPGCDTLNWDAGRVFNRSGDLVCNVGCNTTECMSDGGDCTVGGNRLELV